MAQVEMLRHRKSAGSAPARSEPSHQMIAQSSKLPVQAARLALLAGSLMLLAAPHLIGAQSSKGGLQPTSNSKGSLSANSYAGAQLRQQQQQQTTTTTPVSAGTKRRASPQPIQQQQASGNAYQPRDEQQQVQEGARQQQQPAATTEDPLADSEPALYGSVAGQPGVDFPAYTRIPKTSFSCEGKGFDFGFYADEEAQCQVYHVCWSGRRESFLCGVGTVFNQAILACDYWHSVDCSKSSQFYGVNSELGKAGAEPASGGGGQQQQQQQQQRRPIQAASLPSGANQQAQFGTGDQQRVSSSSASLGQNYGEPVQQRRLQQQQYGADEANFEGRQPQVVQQAARPAAGQSSYNSNNNFVPQRTQAARPSSFSAYEQQQPRVSEPLAAGTKSARNQPQAPPVATTTGSPFVAPSSTLASPAAAAKRPRFMNMDLNQKVNSLIESPVRAPLKPAASPAVYASKQAARQAQQSVTLKPSTRRPAVQQTNFAQQAVARAQQAGSQTLNAGPARKTAASQQQAYQQPQQQQAFDNDLEEPQELQQQQQTFDDSPVQTSTSASPGASYNAAPSRQFGANNNNNNRVNDNFVPQQQQLVIQSGGGPDGSSAITTQYDTILPANQNSDNSQQDGSQLNNANNNYDSSLDDSNNSNDDFRSAGAKAAASHNQNWYIMRTI